MRLVLCFGLAVSLFCLPVGGQAHEKRTVSLDDLYRLRELADPQVSPDGKWVAYTVSTLDQESDKRITHIWMTSWAGGEQIQLTNDPESESAPKWSPDGKYISFVSSRAGKTKGSQIWAMDRRGGDARQITHVKNYSISEYDWSPDSTKLLLVLREKDEPDSDKPKAGADGEASPKPPKPIVIDRYHFKEDKEGYLSDKRNHLYLFTLATEKLEQIANSAQDETNAIWSPDGSRIAFISSQDKDPDRTLNTDVFVVDARSGATPKRLTSYAGPDVGRLSWSPDGNTISYLQGSDSKYNAYSMERLAVVPVSGGAARVLTGGLDRGVALPAFSEGGDSIFCIVADDRVEYAARVSTESGKVERLTTGPVVLSDLSSRSGHTAVIAGTDHAPPELFALEGQSLRKLSTQNDGLVSEWGLGAVEEISFRSRDQTEVHGLITKPPSFPPGTKYPALLRIHGGPNAQESHEFSFEHQFMAAQGYVVISINYRGSSGRGEKYGESIFGDWGDKEIADLLAGVDHVVGMGIADPDRLVVGGWSYGGILTDYMIASDARFKAAISGAGSANQISMYGADQYVSQYDAEIGPPWRNPEKWIKVSYPFFKADRIHTPTLFMGGDKDFNVPLIGSEQMYQALETLEIPTELIIYPGEFHGFTRPSFIRDRYERYVAWYGKYIRASDHEQVRTSAESQSGSRK